MCRNCCDIIRPQLATHKRESEVYLRMRGFLGFCFLTSAEESMKLYVCRLYCAPVWATLSHRKPASAGTSRDSYRAQGHDKGDICTRVCHNPVVKDNEAKFK